MASHPPTILTPSQSPTTHASPPTITTSTSSSSSSSSSSDHEQSNAHSHSNSTSNSYPPSSSSTLQRPKLKSRKSSGTIIVPREHPRLELKEGDEVFDPDDARAMSPRRSSQDLEKMSADAKDQLSEHARTLQASLTEIFTRIEAVKEEHDKLDNNNKFLQKYIGDLMSTSKITASGAGGGGGGRKK